jgi:hypothetical protein
MQFCKLLKFPSIGGRRYRVADTASEMGVFLRVVFTLNDTPNSTKYIIYILVHVAFRLFNYSYRYVKPFTKIGTDRSRRTVKKHLHHEVPRKQVTSGNEVSNTRLSPKQIRLSPKHTLVSASFHWRAHM